MKALNDAMAFYKLDLMRKRLRAKPYQPTHYEKEAFFYMARNDTHQTDMRRDIRRQVENLGEQTAVLQRLADHFTGKQA